MSIYDIDYGQVVKRNIPVRLRRPMRLAWLRVLTAGVKGLYERGFVPFRTDRLYYLLHNSQVCYMEAALNDMFDPEERRIYIDDPAYYDPIYLWRRAEEKPVYLAKRSELPEDAYTAPLYLYRRSELYSVGGIQFIVFYPAGLVYDEARMRALIERYRLVSRVRYAILED